MKKLIPVLLLAGGIMFSGCGDSNNVNEVSGLQGGGGGGGPVGIEPQAVDDLYTTDRNEAFTIAATQGVLANDQLNTNNPAGVTVSYPGTTAQGGTISGGLNDGSFTYNPATGFVGTDTFTYTLNNGFGASTATVSIVVDAAVVAQGFFVDSATGNDATGNFDTGAPFATIQGAVNAAPINANITVRPGNYTGAINLKNGQRLLGAGSTLVNAQGTTRPVLTGPIVLADGNTVDRVRIAGTPGNAIDGDGQNGGTVTNCEIANNTSLGSAVRAQLVNGTWRVENNNISTINGLGVDLRTGGNAQVTAFINNNTITGNAFNALGFISADASQLKVQANNNVMTGNQRGATFEVIAGQTSTASFQILGNRNDDVYDFSVLPSSTAAINVEQLSQLIALNNNTGRVSTGGGSRPATEIPANSIQF